MLLNYLNFIYMVAWFCSILDMPYDTSAEAEFLYSLIIKARFENNRYQRPKKQPKVSTEHVDWLWYFNSEMLLQTLLRSPNSTLHSMAVSLDGENLNQSYFKGIYIVYTTVTTLIVRLVKWNSTENCLLTLLGPMSLLIDLIYERKWRRFWMWKHKWIRLSLNYIQIVWYGNNFILWSLLVLTILRSNGRTG